MAVNVPLVQESFIAVIPVGDELASEFYRILFERHPDFRPLFAPDRFEEQKKKIISALALIVRNLERPDFLRAYLGGLGQMHAAYGILEAYYPAFGECLLAALESVAGGAWSNELKEAWAEAIGAVAELMIAGARKTNI